MVRNTRSLQPQSLYRIKREQVIHWLNDFAQAVRERDYDGGRSLMAPSCVGFGTVARRVICLDELVEQQWRDVWARTRAFRFDTDKAVIKIGDTFVICCMLWQSEGVDPDGGTFPRAGRSTIVLRIEGDELLGVHTHFSMMPGSPRA